MVNGNSLAPDVEDGILTDRGAYIENGQGLYLAPPEVSQSGFVFPQNFTMILWIYPTGLNTYTLLKKGSFLELRLEPSLPEIRAIYNGQVASILNIASAGNYYLDRWGLLSISHKIDSGSQRLELFYNYFLGTTNTFSLAFTDSSSQQLVLGTSHVNSPFKGFIFDLIIYAEIILGTYYTNGHLFISQSVCVRPPYVTDCISRESDPLSNGVGISCSSCPNSCNSDMTCIECDSSCNDICYEHNNPSQCVDMTTVCASGYFDSSNLRCEWSCIANCTACSNSTQCDSCDPGFDLQPDLTCSVGCPSGYTSISQVCTPCHSDCSECLGTTSSDCTACSDPNSSLSSSPGTCSCNPSFYPSSLDALLCSVCDSSCSECSGPSQNECLSCVDPLRVITNGTCVCTTGYFDTTTSCEQCHSDCETCDGDLSSDCLTCSDSKKTVNNGSCVCSINYFPHLDSCIQCHSDCETCDGDLSSDCLTCSDPVKTMDNGSCACPPNSYLQSGECVCEDGFYLKDSKCERKTEIDLNSFDSVESIVISSSVAVASASAILASDPSSVWIILNNLQILTYMPLHALILPRKVEMTCNAFQLSSLLPNLSIYWLGDQLNNEGLPEKWIGNGTQRTNFLLNIGQVLVVLFGYFCYWLIILFLVCVKKDKFIKYLREFRYNIVLRLWVEMFLEVFVASVISLDQLFLQKYDYANFIGGAVFVIQIGSMLWAWRKLYVIKNKFHETPSNIKSRFSSLLYEFDLDKSESSYFFYIYFMIRRAAYVLGLYYLSSTPLLQLMLSLNGSITQILILLLIVKFKDKLNQTVTIAIEALFCILYVLIIYYNSDISHLEEEIFDYLSVGVVGLMGLIVMMNYCVKIYRGLSERCKSKQKAVIDESAVEGKNAEEESKVFEFLQDRRQNKSHNISLYVDNIY